FLFLAQNGRLDRNRHEDRCNRLIGLSRTALEIDALRPTMPAIITLPFVVRIRSVHLAALLYSPLVCLARMNVRGFDCRTFSLQVCRSRDRPWAYTFAAESCLT